MSLFSYQFDTFDICYRVWDLNAFEPMLDKTNVYGFASNADSDLPEHLPSLIRRSTYAQVKNMNEPRHGKTNVLVSDLVRHKQGCTATEDG